MFARGRGRCFHVPWHLLMTRFECGADDDGTDESRSFLMSARRIESQRPRHLAPGGRIARPVRPCPAVPRHPRTEPPVGQRKRSPAKRKCSTSLISKTFFYCYRNRNGFPLLPVTVGRVIALLFTHTSRGCLHFYCINGF